MLPLSLIARSVYSSNANGSKMAHTTAYTALGSWGVDGEWLFCNFVSRKFKTKYLFRQVF